MGQLRSAVQTTASHGRIRRLCVATLAGVVALAVLALSPVSAQTGDPPPATVIGSFCADVPQDYDRSLTWTNPNLRTGDPVPGLRRHHLRSPAWCLWAGGYDHPSPDGIVSHADEQHGQRAASRSGDPGSALKELPAYDGVNAFDDVADDDAHVESINQLADAGIVRGGPDHLPPTSYGPSVPLSRGQMASLIAQALEFLTGTEGANDNDYFTDDDNSIHEPNINALAEVGIAVGDGMNLFDPGQSLTRGQMSAFIMRSLANLEVAQRITPLPAGLARSFAFQRGAGLRSDQLQPPTASRIRSR